MIGKLNEILNKITTIKHWQIIVTLITIILGVIPIVLAVGWLDNPRERLDRLGYTWDEESLMRAISSDDVEAVKAFVDSNFKISGNAVAHALQGEDFWENGKKAHAMRPEELTSTLAMSNNFAADACSRVRLSIEVYPEGWANHLDDNESLAELASAACGSSSVPLSQSKLEADAKFSDEISRIQEGYLNGFCRVDKNNQIRCSNGLEEKVSIIYSSMKKAKSFNNLYCKISKSSDDCLSDAYYERKVSDLMKSYAATGQQCSTRMKNAFSCQDFFMHLENPYGAQSMISTYDSFDAELSKAANFVSNYDEPISDANYCEVYSQAIEYACQ